MDWLLERQDAIERRLAKRHLADHSFGYRRNPESIARARVFTARRAVAAPVHLRSGAACHWRDQAFHEWV